jgi:hypothetical protein
MTAEMWVIAAARVAGSLPVLRWPFWGAVLAMLVDLSDLFMMNLLDLGGVRNYQAFDKWLDQVYMAAFLVVALRWEPWERAVSLALYAYRLVGFLAFETVGERWVLMLFPNLFEPWFLWVAGLRQFKIDLVERKWLAGVAGAALIAVKLFQEYALHVGRWLDGFTAVEAVEAIWDWLVGAPSRLR